MNKQWDWRFLLRKVFVIIPEPYRAGFRRETTRINFYRGKASVFIVFFVICAQTAVLAIQADRPGELFLTVPGTYYTILFSLIVVLLCAFYLMLNHLEQAGTGAGVVVAIEFLLPTVVLLWAVGVTAVDQHFHGHVIFYITAVMGIGVMPLLPPLTLMVIYGFAHTVFLLTIPHYQISPELLAGHYINATAIVVLAWFISRMLFSNHRTEFINQQIIADKNAQLNHLNQKLKELSDIDEVTGIPNRRAFNRVLAREWERAAREKTVLSIILIDIDFFKVFNDSYGHLAGDHCVRDVALVLNESMKRPADFVGRYGGDEFVALLPNTGKTGAAAVAERIRRNVESLAIIHAYSTASPYVTVSLGAYTGQPDQKAAPEDFLEAVDQALYRAKQGERNTVVSTGGRPNDSRLSGTGHRAFPGGRGTD